MKLLLLRFPLVLVGLAVFLSFDRVHAAPLLDDRAITITNKTDLTRKRAELIQYLWGPAGFPAKPGPTRIRANIPSPVQQLTRLARVDEFQFDLAPDLQGLAYHFIAERPNGALVVVHHGHACTLDDDPSPEEKGYGLQRTIATLLQEGCGVLGVFMPHMRPGDCSGRHEAVMEMKTTGSPLKFFLEPVVFSLNYLKSPPRAAQIPRYRDFHMVGLSGGGWTTTVYAAIDPTIRCSFPVAGTIPLYLRSGGSVGDREQFEPSFYGIAGYPDLYILGAYGKGRRQVQILVRRDDCCFGQAQHDPRPAGGLAYEQAMREYAGNVTARLGELRRGSFQLAIDDVAPSHMISHHAIRDLILPALR